jgi:UDPglucose 6-dehydrogenase
MTTAKVAIIGLGWVGKAQNKLFPDAVVYSNGKRGEIGSRDEINKCDMAFICVPSPNIGEGKLDISMVEQNVAWCECPVIVIRSTVNPGTCDYLAKKYNKHIVMQPEYLGETPAHPMLDQKERNFIVIGGDKADLRKVIDVYATVYNANTTIRQLTALEAEIVKITENRAIAFKVAQCQELYDVCVLAGVDYYTIREAVYSDDPRFNLWWSFIYPEKRGFKSKCIPKDIYAWCAWAESLGYNPQITRAILKKNHEWIG